MSGARIKRPGGAEIMAQKFYIYQPDSNNMARGTAGENGNYKPLAITADDDIMGLYADLVKKQTASDGTVAAATNPTGYADLDALLAVAPTAVQNNRISPRGLTLLIPGFGSAFMPILSNEVQLDTGELVSNVYNATVQNWTDDSDVNDANGPAEGSTEVLI